MLKRLLLTFLLLALIQSNSADQAFEDDKDIVTKDFITNLILQGNDLLAQQKYDSAIILYMGADSLATLSDDFESKTNCKHNIGLCYYRDGKYTLSREYFGEAINLSLSANDELKTAKYQISLGVLYKQLSIYDKSMQLIMKSIVIAEKHKDLQLMAMAYNSIAGIQNTLGNYQGALEYYFLVADIFTELDYKTGLAKVYNNIGNVYTDSGNYELSKKYYFKSLKTKQRILETASLVPTYKNLGDVCLFLNQLDSADTYYKKALKQSIEVNHEDKIAYSLIALADLNFQKKEYSSSFMGVVKSFGYLVSIFSKRALQKGTPDKKKALRFRKALIISGE